MLISLRLTLGENALGITYSIIISDCAQDMSGLLLCSVLMLPLSALTAVSGARCALHFSFEKTGSEVRFSFPRPPGGEGTKLGCGRVTQS